MTDQQQTFFSRRSGPPTSERTTIEIPLIHFKPINAFGFEGAIMKSREEAIAMLANAMRLGEAVFSLLAKGYQLGFVSSRDIQAPPTPYNPLGRSCSNLPGDTTLTVRAHPCQASRFESWAKTMGQKSAPDGVASAFSLFHEIRDYQQRGHYLTAKPAHKALAHVILQ